MKILNHFLVKHGDGVINVTETRCDVWLRRHPLRVNFSLLRSCCSFKSKNKTHVSKNKIKHSFKSIFIDEKKNIPVLFSVRRLFWKKEFPDDVQFIVHYTWTCTETVTIPLRKLFCQTTFPYRRQFFEHENRSSVSI